MPSPWCVRHRDGWCATADGKQHDEGAISVATRCGHYVILPWGSARRAPTCPECRHPRPSDLGADQ